MMGAAHLRNSEIAGCLDSGLGKLGLKPCLYLFLLYERAKGDSFWKPYIGIYVLLNYLECRLLISAFIDILPLDFSYLPAFWSEEDIAELQFGPWIKGC
jgi:hypothetical protein